jgi:hypothetical protein
LEEKRCLLIKKFAVAANCIGMNDTVLQEFLTSLIEFVNSTKLGNQFGFVLQNPPTRSLDFNDSFDNSTGRLEINYLLKRPYLMMILLTYIRGSNTKDLRHFLLEGLN